VPVAPRASRLALTALTAAWLLQACAGGGDRPPRTSGRLLERGLASWYGEPFHGRRTANGEVYDMHAVSAAHKTLPFGTRVRVDNLDNGKSLVVRINDRGPFIRGRIIDLSLGAARQLGMVEAGVVRVRLTRVEGPSAVERRQRQGPFAVQVGAFLERRNAENLLNALRDDHPEARIVGDGRWFRVRITGIADLPRAEEIVRQLRRSGNDAFVAP
jgi:rare lipoprotein A